ncbi:MAG: YeeE/YedE family protein [Deltaproteobacteria bacterium]|nr:YeeE/YedE family protein [Deltaproteobacteria bacterium]
MNPDFSPLSALFGGALIGLSAGGMLLLHGRVAGISGIVGGLLHPKPGDVRWRAAFVLGLLTAGLVSLLSGVDTFPYTLDRAPWMVGLAGLLVGFGTRLGNGCTSGHGVCGLARFSQRSLVAVVTFMATGMITAVLVDRLLGGA